MVSINTNLSSLITQNSLKMSSFSLNQAIERMTTGYKINHASDNAANYSIATNMTTKISALQVAEDNALQGLTMISSAMENLDLVSKHLSRVRSLVEMAANGAYSEGSFRAIQAEIDARLVEGRRVISESEYNGIQLFQGELKTGDFVNYVTRLSKEEALSQGYTVISSADELQQIQDDLSGKYILMNDIDLSGYNWASISDFAGELNGNGYVIKNLTTSESGLFNTILSGKVLNLGIVNINITSADTSYKGALAGNISTSTTITNCYSTGCVRGRAYVGGLVGMLSGNNGNSVINDSYSTCDVISEYKGWGDWGYAVGGLVGFISYSTNALNNCYSSGNLSGGDTGGLVGNMTHSSINNCYASAIVNGAALSGGLVGGAKNSYINDCYSKSSVTNSVNAGALVGELQGYSISNCWFYSSINPDLAAVGVNSDGSDLSTVVDKVTLETIAIPNIISFQIGTDSAENSGMSFDLEFTLDLSLTITDSVSARNSLGQIEELLVKLNNRQTEFGTAYNRLESALDEISTQYENLVSSRSTIRDADMAEVSSEYIRQQILQQASATLLATANQSPSIALQLI